MTDLFERVCNVTIDDLRLEGLDVTVGIEKSLFATPNSCALTIFNLREDHRTALEEFQFNGSRLVKKIKPIPVQIEAGYVGQTSLIWFGDLRTGFSTWDGATWETRIESGSGELAFQTGRINTSFGPGTSVETALRALVRALGVGEGNISRVAHKIKIAGLGKVFPRGVVLSGQVSRELTALCRSANLEWSIQDGVLQLLERGEALSDTAIRLAPDCGLVGSPSVDNMGVLTAKMLMIPELRPGCIVRMDAARIKGEYRVIKAKWSLDTAATDWYIDIEARPPGLMDLWL